MGNQVIFLRNRNLTSNDTANFFKIYIDSDAINQLVVLNTFYASDGLALQQYFYGSIATVNKVIPPSTPAFISLSAPYLASKFVPTQNLPTDPLMWAYMTSSPGNTTINVLQANSSFSNNLQSTDITLDGTISIITMNSNCFIVKDSSNNIQMVTFTAGNSSSSNSSRSYRVDNLSPLLYNTSVAMDINVKWGISDTCDSFSANKLMFYRPSL